MNCDANALQNEVLQEFSALQAARPTRISFHPNTLKDLLLHTLEIPRDKEVKEPLYFLGMRVEKNDATPEGRFALLP